MSVFRRQVAEGVAIKMGAGDSKTYLMNEKMEYNRCLVPDLLELETPEQSEAQNKLDEKKHQSQEAFQKIVGPMEGAGRW